MSAENDSFDLKRAAEGDEAAVEALLIRYKPLVLSRASRFYLKGGDSDDLIQEGMIALFHAIISCPPERWDSFSAYAFTAVDNRLKDTIRRANSGKARVLNDSLSLEAPAQDPGTAASYAEPSLGDTIHSGGEDSPEEEVLRGEALDELLTRIKGQLSPLECRALLLFAAGESYQQIAERLQVSRKSVDGALRRARKKLKD